jgi:hypothetical protein
MWHYFFMSGFSPDQAPEMCSVTIPFEDGTSIQLSHPRTELDKMPPDDKDQFLDSVGALLSCLAKGVVPDAEDIERVMSVEGVSLVLPEDHGSIEVQRILGQHLLTGTQEDLGKYDQPE